MKDAHSKAERVRPAMKRRLGDMDTPALPSSLSSVAVAAAASVVASSAAPTSSAPASGGGAAAPLTAAIAAGGGGTNFLTGAPFSARYASILAGRQKLPVWQFLDELNVLCRSNQVIVVEGETGSGKTTQVRGMHNKGGRASCFLMRVCVCVVYFDTCSPLSPLLSTPLLVRRFRSSSFLRALAAGPTGASGSSPARSRGAWRPCPWPRVWLTRWT